MLSAKLFLNVPRIMEFLFGVFSAFSDAATRAKFVVASPARAREVLVRYIDPAQAPCRFGGFLETCCVPPKSGRPAAFSIATSKHVVLKSGESHVTSKLVGPDSEVVWGFCSTGPELQVSIGFRPRDNGEAAAAAACQPDHVAGTPHPNSPHRDAQHITESHSMALVKDSASGRLVLGCAGEVVMTIENNRGSGLFVAGPSVRVHYVLLASGAVSGRGVRATGSMPLSEASTADGGGGSGRLWVDGTAGSALDVRQGPVFSYKSFGCSSLASNDVGFGDLGADAGELAGSPLARPLQPPHYANGALVAGAAAGSGRFETVEEADESSAISPKATTVADARG
ncbi:hypothetical protein GPECTOR_114g306 [Gonium pectorale]|uniref:CRAL-TRIO domain-containing protein n=1 Tax=Gonium pectorale TaxID=33097 RepID=A0A150G069_GONPE|nr:hypothetical protein GPECTOR_114g306 [Gonium pectorale]|eukprot:KXZ42855.1 hypothetical protein GPECTOR_114g306 [Gonium pectorale]